MANYASLISSIQSVVRENGNNEITGDLLQQTLLSIVASLGSGYQFIGVATPSTNPGTPDQRVFYFCNSGAYPNFGPAVIPSGAVGILYYDNGWHSSYFTIGIGDGSITEPKIDSSFLSKLLAGFVYVGVATPSTNPGTPSRDCFYMTSTVGTYTNFGNLVVGDAEIAVLRYTTSNNVWSKESIPIPELIEIIDNLQSPATDKALSANQGRILKEMIGDVQGGAGTVTNVPFSRAGYYDGATHQFVTNTVNDTTPLIPLENVASVLYTGRMGGTCATWFDANGGYIGQSVDSNGNTLVGYEVLDTRPYNAAYVALTTRNNNHSAPPTVPPACVVTTESGFVDLQTQINRISFEPTNIPFGLSGYYDDSGIFITNNTNLSTEKIELSQYKRLILSGAGNGIFTFYDANDAFITQVYTRNITGGGVGDFIADFGGLDIYLYAPTNAAYVGVSVRRPSYSPAPISSNKLLAYTDRKSEFVQFGVIANGITDTTSALQNLLNNCGSVINFPRGTYLISSSLVVKPGIVKRINGNGAIIKVTQDVPAIVLSGNMQASSTADPDSLPLRVIDGEANTVIDGLVVTASTPSIGTGIKLSYAFEPVVCNCYIHHINNGLVIADRCRNVIIANNNIYCCNNYGLKFEQGSNCHQCNITGNHISYTRICLGIVQSQQTANLQITGNDIEIATWPTDGRTNQRCIVIDYQNTSNALCSEIEIVGNTIQGHEYSNGLIDISGVIGGMVENISVVGNQISNVAGYAVKFTNVHNVSCGGNTFRRISNKVYELAGTINGMVIDGEVCESGTGFVNSSSSANVYSLTLGQLTGKGMSGGINLNCALINGLVVSGCNVSTSGITVSATDIDYVSVTGNILRGNYNIATCTHRVVENNL